MICAAISLKASNNIEVGAQGFEHWTEPKAREVRWYVLPSRSKHQTE